MQPPPTDYTAELLKFVRTLAQATGDLSQLTCPSFLLSGLSLLELSLHWADHASLLTSTHIPINTATAPEHSQEPAPPNTPNAPQHHLEIQNIAQWLIGSFYGSYHSRCIHASEKKPFNPVLGEWIKCAFEDPDKNHVANMVVEQVSHHPPVTAFALTRPDGVNMYGHCGQKTTFSSTGTVKVIQVGRVTIEMGTRTYIVYPLPELSVAGILSGKVFVECLGSVTVECVSDSSDCASEESGVGVKCELKFVPKGWFYGDYFGIKGEFFDSKSQVFAELSGNWTTQTFIKHKSTDSVPNLFYDTKAPAHSRVFRGEPTSEQDDMSLNTLEIWTATKTALGVQDYGVASQLKSEIEERAREVRKNRVAPFSPRYFEFVPVEASTFTDSSGKSRSTSSLNSIGGTGSASKGLCTRDTSEGVDVTDVSEKARLGYWIYKR